MSRGLPAISYPVLMWRAGYIYLAATPLELCTHPRSLFDETVRRSQSGEYRLLDLRGRYYRIEDWTRIPPFGGAMGVLLRLMRSIFAAPVLTNEKQLALPEFKKKIADAMRSRYRYDLDKYPAVDTVRKLEAAQTYAEAMDAIPKL